MNDGRTRPAEVELLAEPPALPDRSVPIRFRKNVPTAWLRLTIREGRNRQVRRMTAAVGHPTLRLVRVAVGPISLGDLTPGEWRDLTADGAEALGKLRGEQARPALVREPSTAKIVKLCQLLRPADVSSHDRPSTGVHWRCIGGACSPRRISVQADAVSGPEGFRIRFPARSSTMASPARVDKMITLEEFLRMPEIDEHPYMEFIDGRIEAKLSPQKKHGRSKSGS